MLPASSPLPLVSTVRSSAQSQPIGAAVEVDASPLFRPLVIDLFCGRGGWTRAFLDAGFDVIGVDLLPQPDYPGPFMQADLRTLHAWEVTRRPVYAVLASPPCEAFSTIRPDNHEVPDPLGFELMAHAFRLIAEFRPVWWAIENVRGALKWWEPLASTPDRRDRPYYVWGRVPEDFRPQGPYPSKLQYRAAGQRAEIPAQLAAPLAASIMRHWLRSPPQSQLHAGSQSKLRPGASSQPLPAAGQSNCELRPGRSATVAPAAASTSTPIAVAATAPTSAHVAAVEP